MNVVAVYRLLHRSGCGELAYFVEEYSVIGEHETRARSMYANGSYIAEGEIERCSTCGRPIRPSDITPQNLEPLDLGARH